MRTLFLQPDRRKLARVLTSLLVAFASASLSAQASYPFSGSVTTSKATLDVLPLSIDEAIRRGLEFNLAVVNERYNLSAAEGQRLQTLQGLLPTVTAEAETGYKEIDLTALGLKTNKLPLPPGVTVSPIVKVAITDAKANLQLPIFNMPVIENYRAAKEQIVSEQFRVLSVRGLVVLNVGTTYLQALADASNLDNANSLLLTDREVLRQAHDEHIAGTAANLDELRARVTYQQQQQAVIAAENALEKTKIALARQIGIAPEQKLQLTDPVPYADITLLTLDEARTRAYHDRKDYQTLQHAVRAASFRRSAARSQRLPALNSGGNYGVTGETTGTYHGTFVALASLSFPIFREAGQRGDVDVADAELRNQQSQLDDLRSKIDGQLRDSFFDIRAAQQLVTVARSNLDLATETLDQATQRFQAGVDDTLPVTQAQTQLAAAQSQLVQSLLQLNTAKLGLARNLGILEYEFDAYLHDPSAGHTPASTH